MYDFTSLSAETIYLSAKCQYGRMDCHRDTSAQKVLLFLDYTPFFPNDLDIEGQKTVIGHLAVVSMIINICKHPSSPCCRKKSLCLLDAALKG